MSKVSTPEVLHCSLKEIKHGCDLGSSYLPTFGFQICAWAWRCNPGRRLGLAVTVKCTVSVKSHAIFCNYLFHHAETPL